MFEILEHIERAWNVFTKNFLTFAVAELIATLIPGLIFLLGVFAFLGTLSTSIAFPSFTQPPTEEMIENYIRSLISNPEIISKLMPAIGAASVFFLVAILVSMFLDAGIYGMVYESLRRRTRLRTMFKAARVFGFRAVGYSLVRFLILLFLLILSFPLGIVIPIIGFFIGIIFLIIVSAMFSLGLPAIVADRVGVIEAIRKSFRVVGKNFLEVFILLLIFGLTGIVVGWVPYFIGILFSMLVVSPLQKITFVGYYMKKKRGL